MHAMILKAETYCIFFWVKQMVWEKKKIQSRVSYTRFMCKRCMLDVTCTISQSSSILVKRLFSCTAIWRRIKLLSASIEHRALATRCRPKSQSIYQVYFTKVRRGESEPRCSTFTDKKLILKNFVVLRNCSKMNTYLNLRYDVILRFVTALYAISQLYLPVSLFCSNC